MRSCRVATNSDQSPPTAMHRTSSSCKNQPDDHNSSFTSGMTIDLSDRSTFDFSGHRGSLGDDTKRSSPTSIDGRRSCMKVRTQRESLSKIEGAEQQRLYASERSTQRQRSLASSNPGIAAKLPRPSSIQALSAVSEKSVHFSNIQFKEYTRILSDNPSTSGPPIGLGWRFYEPVTIDLDHYESTRDGSSDGQSSRRCKSELSIPAELRQDMLREVGYSRKEITAAIRQARKDRENRTVSYHQQKYDPLFERMDIVKKGFRKVIMRKNSKDMSLHHVSWTPAETQ